MRPKSKCNRRLLCEMLEPRAMLSGTGSFVTRLPDRLDVSNVAASVMGPVLPKAMATVSSPFVGVNVGIGLQAQAAATASAFLAGISNNPGALNSTIIGPPDPFATSRGLASPIQIGPTSPTTSAVIPATNTLSPLVNSVSGLTNTLNAITSNSNASSGLGNPFNTASNTLLVLTNTLNALVNATLFSDINGFLGSATSVVQVSPGNSISATPIVQANLGILTGATLFAQANSGILTVGPPFAQANSGLNATVALVLSTVSQAQTAVNNAIAQSTGPIAPLVGQVLASSQSLVNNLAPLQSFNNPGAFAPTNLGLLA